MNNIIKNIYDDISCEILKFFEENKILYNVDKENKEIQNEIEKNEKSEHLYKDIDELRYIKKFDKRIIALFNYLEKLVSTVPRKVFFSKRLSNKMEDEIDKNIKDKIYLFKEKFELGKDVNSNLSKLVFDSNSWDYILNIWNIRHLHLSNSTNFDKKYMSKNRSDYLLFFVINNSNVYFIDVRKHPKGAGFTSFEFLEILDESNWLTIIGLEKMEGISNVNFVAEKDEDIYKLTKSNNNLIYKINNNYYKNPMGISTVGNKIIHTEKLIEIKGKIKKLAKNQQIEYISFKLDLREYFGKIKYRINDIEKQIIL